MAKTQLVPPKIESARDRELRAQLDDYARTLLSCNNSVEEIIAQVKQLPFNSKKRHKLLGRLNTTIVKFNKNRKKVNELQMQLKVLV